MQLRERAQAQWTTSGNDISNTNSGNVGIGTSTPAHRLDVLVNAQWVARFKKSDSTNGGIIIDAAASYNPNLALAVNGTNKWFMHSNSSSSDAFQFLDSGGTARFTLTQGGNVGIGTASPTALFTSDKVVHIQGASNPHIRVTDTTNTVNTFLDAEDASGNIGTASNHNFNFFTNNAQKMTILAGGNVGIGTTAPTQTLSVNGTAGKPGGGTWDVFSDERLKNIKGRYNTGLKALMQLQPLRYEYKADNPLGIKSEGEYVGFGAQSLQKIIPEAVVRDSSGYLMVKSDPILWTMLNAIKEQQKEIADLKAQVQRLQNSRRPRK